MKTMLWIILIVIIAGVAVSFLEGPLGLIGKFVVKMLKAPFQAFESGFTLASRFFLKVIQALITLMK